MKDKSEYWLWLYSVIGPCNAKFIDMLEEFDSIENIYEMRGNPAFLARLSPGELGNLKTATLKSAGAMSEQCRGQGINIVYYKGESYPSRLCRTKIPPMVLFVTGKVAALEPVFAVAGIGARFSTEYGRAAVRQICEPLAKSGICLISGMAFGIDSEVHKIALNAKGPTVAVLGTPIDVTYPAANKELRTKIEQSGGAVVSEYAPGGETQKYMFSQRNRIVSGLAQVVVIFEAAKKSGTMITAAWALDDGREVFAVPGSILSPHSEGTNYLIKNGATPALSALEILESLDLPTEGCEQLKLERDIRNMELSDVQKKLYNTLEDGELSLDDIAARTGMQPHIILSELTELEMEGVVISKGGSRYARKLN